MARKAIVVVVQRDLLRRIAGYVITLEQGGNRTPLEEHERLRDELDAAKIAQMSNRASVVRVDDPGEKGKEVA